MQNQDDSRTLDLNALRYFELAAEHKSFTSAAVARGLAQSAFSRYIGQLEKTLGGPLFYRTGRGVTLTERGRRLQPTARRLLQEADALVDSMNSAEHELAGVVALGLVPGLCHPIVGQLFNFLRRNYPRLRLNVTEGHSGDIEIMLSRGEIDVGVFNRYRPQKGQSRRSAVMESDMVLVGVGLSGPPMTFRQAAELPLALSKTPNSLRSYIEEIAARQRLKLNIVFESGPGLAMADAVLHGKIYTILPPHAAASLWEAGQVQTQRLTHPGIRQATLVETTRQHPVSAATRIVLQQTSRLIREAAVPAPGEGP